MSRSCNICGAPIWQPHEPGCPESVGTTVPQAPPEQTVAGAPAASSANISLETSVVKDSTLNISQRSDANRPNPVCDSDAQSSSAVPSASISLGTSVIRNSSIHISQDRIVQVVQDPHAQARRAFEDRLHEVASVHGLREIVRTEAALTSQARETGLSEREAAAMIAQHRAGAINELRGRIAAGRNLRRYRLTGHGADPLRRLSGAEVVALLNRHAASGNVPMVQVDGRDGQRPIWAFDEIVWDPELRMHCALTNELLAPEQMEPCADCTRPFRAEKLDVSRRCPACARAASLKAQAAATPEAETPSVDPVPRIDVKSKLDAALWRRVRAGRFRMGSPPDEPGRSDDEDLHDVVLTRGLMVLAQPVSEALYAEVCAGSGSGELPKRDVSWLDAIRFCNAYSGTLGLPACYSFEGGKDKVGWDKTRQGVRLLTEAEWEYACRSGSTAMRYMDVGEDLYRIAVYETEEPETLGQTEPNAFGLHDMLGSVWEWVWDCYGPYPREPATDPTGREGGTSRVLRGGCYEDSKADIRCARRLFALMSSSSPIYGFRVCVSL